MADKVKEVALDEVQAIKAQTVQAARSAAYLYPLRVSAAVSTGTALIAYLVTSR